MSRTRQIKSSVHIPISGFNYFFSALGRHHSMAWAWMAIRVSGQRQKHGASLADEIAKWRLPISGDPLPPPPTYSRTLFCRHGCWSVLGPCSRAIEGNLLSRAHFSELTSLTSSGRLRPPPPQSSYSSSPLSPSSCRRPSPSPPLSSCCCRRRPHVFRCHF